METSNSTESSNIAPDPAPTAERQTGSPRHAWAIAPGVFAALTLGMFFDLLFTTHRVASSITTDLASQFISWREFGFSQLAQGNLALWNPHVFGGTPYFAGFQSALLYPPNWLHLILPMAPALNWIMAMHVFAAGYFTYLWCRGWRIGIGGSILSGVMFMFSGPYFLHLYAGHLPHLAVMVWAPLMLLTVDKLAETGSLRWCMLGVFATSMQILAGHPQYVYYTGIALSIYTALRMIRSGFRLSLAGGFVMMYAGAVLVSAVQLWPGFQVLGEQVRSSGIRYEMASTFALPPQNLLTLLVPSFFGSLPMNPAEPPAGDYWGAGYLWEMSLFISITGLIFAVLGTIRGQRRTVLLIAAMVLITGVLAFGRHTPLYRVMYDYMPAYGSFRGAIKFAYLSVLFISLLAAMGFDSLLRERRVSWGLILAVAMLSLIVATFGAMVWSAAAQGSDGWWSEFVNWVRKSAGDGNELFLQMQQSSVQPAGERAGLLTCLAAAMLAGVAAMLWASRLHRWAPYLLIIAASAEMFIFAYGTRATLDPAQALTIPEPWRAPLATLPKNQRCFMPQANLGLSLGFDNLNGYDPGVLKRYAELIYASQGQDPAAATQYLFLGQLRLNLPVFRMLRCGLIFYNEAAPPAVVPNPLPEALVISDWVKLTSPKGELAYITGGSFEPGNTVVLNADPGIKTIPAAAPPGQAHVVSRSTDSLELQVDMARPGILVVTNNYSTGWQVIPLTAGQQNYDIVPANYTQIGIPLEKGAHHFILEYSPLAFRAGRWISILSLLGYAGLSVLLMRGRCWFR